VFLHEKNFMKITLIKSKRSKVADIICEKNEEKVCCEVKAITKRSDGRAGFFLEEQVYEKILESISTAGAQHCPATRMR